MSRVGGRSRDLISAERPRGMGFIQLGSRDRLPEVWLHYLLIVTLGQVIYSVFFSFLVHGIRITMASFYTGVLGKQVINPAWHVGKFPRYHCPRKSYSSLFQSQVCLCWSGRGTTWSCRGGTGLLGEMQPSR